MQVHYHHSTRQNPGHFEVRSRGSKTEPLRRNADSQKRIIFNTAQEIFAGKARRDLYAKSREKFGRAVTAAMRRMPEADVSARMAVLAPLMAKHAPTLNPPAHPEEEWFHPLTDRIHALWLRVRDTVTKVRSTSAIRYFTATVVHELGQPRGMVVGTTTVLAPHAGCGVHSIRELDYREILSKSKGGGSHSCCGHMHKARHAAIMPL